MIDRSKRYMRETHALERMPILEGKQIYFDSMAEMVTVRAQEIPDKVHVYYYDEVITYAQTNERSNKVANYLKSKGVSRGDVVSIMILNSPDCYYSTFGAQKLGAIAGQVNYMLAGPEIAYVLDDSKPKVAFVGSEFITSFAKGYEMAKHKPIVVEVVTAVERGYEIADTTMADILATFPADEALVPQSGSDPFMLMYSSGTTGRPKGVLLSNRNQFANCKDMARFGVNNPDDVFLLLAPMFHTSPLCVWSYPLTYMGLAICIRKTFSPADFWPSVMRYGITEVWGTPAMYMFVLYQVDTSIIDPAKNKLRLAFAGGAPVFKELIVDFKEKFGVEVVDGYGLTEGCGVATSGCNIPLKLGSVGQALFEQEIEIMDPDNNILPYGEVGEICIKGECVMLGYLNQPEETAAALKDGWLHTGDLGTMDEQGYIYYAGRLKEMINRGGENIYPREIEMPLEAHPKIAEVAVVGVPDAALGERVKACIVLKEPGSMTTQEVKDYLKELIARYKIPEIVQFYDVFPRNASGKVMKKELTD